MPVLSSYLVNAMKEANYKLLDDGSYYGEIKKCPGVWANEETLEQCRLVLSLILNM